MTLSTLLIYVGLAALILTGITHIGFKATKRILMSYVQHFCGALFIFSGYVKAIDPLGTAYKMEQYFDQFEAVFQTTWFSFLSPLFPVLSSYSVAFAVAMIIFEIVLGFMLILGHKPKLSAWSFLLLVAFFTILTGFTYLTGYVPSEANFFNFSAWGEYKQSNMKVTDCGCFGDFIKLEPKVSFLKDVFLLIPAIFFLWKSDCMHTISTRTIRNISVSILTIGLLYYCLSNYHWDLPKQDFRPFKKGRDIRAQRELEDRSTANTRILFYDVTEKSSKIKKRIPYEEYLKTFKDYPSAEWDLEQIYSDPEVPPTKISDFNFYDLDGYDLSPELLSSEGVTILIIAHKMYADGVRESVIVRDTVYRLDTIITPQGEITYASNIQRINERSVDITNFMWKGFYEERYTNVVKPFVETAKKDGIRIIMIAGGVGSEQLQDFETDIALGAEYATADDILLKTIVRSNPGIVLFKNGVILDKWHYKKLPSYDSIKNKYFN